MVAILYFVFVGVLLTATANAFGGSDCGRDPWYRALLYNLDHNPCMSDNEVWGRILNVNDSCRHEAFQKLHNKFMHDLVPAQCVCSGGYSTWNFVYNFHNMVCPTYLRSLLRHYNHGAPSCETHHFIWNYLRNLPTATFTPVNNQHYDHRCLNEIVSTLSTAMHHSRSTCTCTRKQQAVQTTATSRGPGYCHATMDCRDLGCSSATHAVCMHHVCKCQPFTTRTCHDVTVDCRHYPQCSHGNQYACIHGVCRCAPSLTTTVPATTHGTPTYCHTRTDCNHLFCHHGHYPVCTRHSHRCICESMNRVCHNPITDCHYPQCPHRTQHTCVNLRCACTAIPTTAVPTTHATVICNNPKTDCYFLNCFINHQFACVNSKCQCVQTPTTTKTPHSEVCHNPAVDCKHEICSHGYHKTCVARVCTCLIDPTTTTTTTTTTEKPTTPAPIRRNCDALKVLSGVAHNAAVGRHGCPDGQHSPVVYFVQRSCNRIGANWNSWTEGKRVKAICSTLPHYTAIAHFKGGAFDKQFKTSNAGVFIGCANDHFKMVTEDCHTNLHVKHIEFSNPDSAHYYVIQQH